MQNLKRIFYVSICIFCCYINGLILTKRYLRSKNCEIEIIKKDIWCYFPYSFLRIFLRPIGHISCNSRYYLQHLNLVFSATIIMLIIFIYDIATFYFILRILKLLLSFVIFGLTILIYHICTFRLLEQRRSTSMLKFTLLVIDICQ